MTHAVVVRLKLDHAIPLLKSLKWLPFTQNENRVSPLALRTQCAHQHLPSHLLSLPLIHQLWSPVLFAFPLIIKQASPNGLYTSNSLGDPVPPRQSHS